MLKKLCLCLFCLLTFLIINAQEAPNPPPTFQINFTYAIHQPLADLNDRFGQSNSVGGGVTYMFRNRMMIGVDFDFVFGSNVDIDVLRHFRNQEGGIVGNDLEYASIFLRERGSFTGLMFGKLFQLGKKSPISGIKLNLGAGVLTHKIRLLDNANSTTQILGEYAKGYDRFTMGPALKQFVGYHHLSKNRRVNFYFGMEIIEGFTKNQRSFNFDDFQAETDTRLDVLVGLKLGWVLPFYLESAKTESFY